MTEVLVEVHLGEFDAVRLLIVELCGLEERLVQTDPEGRLQLLDALRRFVRSMGLDEEVEVGE